MLCCMACDLFFYLDWINWRRVCLNCAKHFTFELWYHQIRGSEWLESQMLRRALSVRRRSAFVPCHAFKLPSLQLVTYYSAHILGATHVPYVYDCAREISYLTCTTSVRRCGYVIDEIVDTSICVKQNTAAERYIRSTYASTWDMTTCKSMILRVHVHDTNIRP